MKKINTLHVIKNTNPESLIVLFVFKPLVIIVKIGIKEIGSIATNALKKILEKQIMHKKKFIVSSFYKFVYLRNPDVIKKKLFINLKEFNIRGTFILGKRGYKCFIFYISTAI